MPEFTIRCLVGAVVLSGGCRWFATPSVDDSDDPADWFDSDSDVADSDTEDPHHEKEEYLAQVEVLGADRIEDLPVPGTGTIDLTGTSGLYGYRVPILGGQTVRFCVNADGSVSIMYYPHYAPGYTYLDTDPGCTEITNRDATFANDVMLVLEGQATATASVVAL